MAAATALHDVAPATLKARLERNDAILMDVREADEYARDPIADARPHPLSRLMAASLPRVPGKKLVLQCNSGNRTRQAATAILAREPIELDHRVGRHPGLEEGRPAGPGRPRGAAADHAPGQIAAGSLVLLGLLLALLLSPWSALPSALVGAGLLFAGITGRCGMAKLFERLPYNRPAPHAASV